MTRGAPSPLLPRTLRCRAGRLLVATGAPMPEEAVTKVLSEFDVNKDGMIDFDEFLTILANRQNFGAVAR